MSHCAIHRRLGLLLVALLLVSATPGRALADEGNEGPSWAFSHPADPFKASAIVDLRYLNEKEAGQSGFLRLAPGGRGFALGDGTPVRLWAVGSDVYRKASREEMARHARFLAKLGVNMVRIHTQLAPGKKGSRLTDVDEGEIDRIRQFVAALKKEGIYVTISPYWATRRDVSDWGIDGYTGDTEMWGLLFFEEKLQEGYKAWARALYEPNNPYTGIPLAKDPAVGIIQVQNEDSLLFWTFSGLKGAGLERLSKKFGHWLVEKHGSLEKARAAWAGTKHDQDNFANGKAGLFSAWHMTQPWQGGMAKRLDDQCQFIAETQRRFYAEIGAFFRKELGCKQLLNASNWVTADLVRLNDAERWSYAALDVIAVNKYTGGLHTGANNGWRIDPGHHFTNQSCLIDPRALPINLRQVVGRPTVVTESTWVHPERYQSEGPFLIAAYQSLTGVGGFYWFSATTAEYDLDPSLRFLNRNGQHPWFKWSCSAPVFMSQFPAAALLYRKGYVRQGDPVIHEERPLDDLWQRKPPLVAEDRGFDPNRYKGATVEKSNVPGGADPLAFLVGPVEVRYGGDPRGSATVNLNRYIDHEKKKVRSITEELSLDYGTGLCTVDAPKAQGASGFLAKAGEIQLTDVTIRSGNEYATVTVVPLDDRPLHTSKKVLVQVGTTARLTGWKAKPAEFKGDGNQLFKGYEIVATGLPPWRIAETDVTLTVRNPGLTNATLLDTSGYAAKKLEGQSANGTFTLKLPGNALYVVLE